MTKQTNGHTPGPWVFVNATNSYIRPQYPGDYIASMIHPEDLRGLKEPLNEQQLANARLIAAAPELLEALLPFVNPPKTTYGARIIDEKHYENAKKAIAKAEGEISHS